MSTSTKEFVNFNLQTSGANKVQGDIAKVRKAIASYKDENKDLRVVQAKLESQGHKNGKEWKALREEIKKNNTEITKKQGKLKQLNSKLKLSEMTSSQLRKKTRDLRKEISHTSKAIEPKRWNKLNKELKNTETQMKKVRYGTKKVSGLMSNLKSVLPIISIGAITAGFKRLFSVISKNAKVQSTLAKQTGLTGDELKKLTQKVIVLSDTWEQDYNKVITASNTLAKEMGISHRKSLDLIEKGFEKGANNSQEFLKQLREYPSQMKAVGISAQETIAIITKSVDEGIYSDKGIDAIKEAGIRIREMTPATEEALNKIGLSAEEIKRQLNEGTMSMFEAIQHVSNKMGELPETSNEVGQALADIFGGPGEDAGLRYIKMLGDINTDLESMESTLSDVEQAQKGMKSEWSELTSSVTSGTGALSKAFTWLLNQIQSVIEGIRYLNMSDEDIFMEQTLDDAQENFNEFSKSMQRSNKEIIAENKKMIAQYEEYLQNMSGETEDAKQLKKVINDLTQQNKSLANSQKEITEQDYISAYKSKIQELNVAIAEQRDLITDDTSKKDRREILWFISRARNEVMLYEEAIQEIKSNPPPPPPEPEVDEEKTVDKYKQLLDRLRELQHAWELEQMSAHERERQKIRDKYKQEIEAAEGHHEIVKELEQLQREELSALEEEWETEQQEKAYNKMMERLELNQSTKINALKEQKLEQLITEKEYNQMLLEEELAYLQLKKEAMKKNGEDITKIESQILDAQIALQQKQTDEMKKSIEEKIDLYSALSEDVGGIIGETLSDQEKGFDAFVDNMIVSMLDFLKKVMRVQIAKATMGSLASAESIATFGAAGVAKAAILTGLLEAAFAAAKASVTQRASGKYDVIGADDGHVYNNVPMIEDPGTGIYKKPTLFAERGDELIVNNKHLRNLQMQRPWVIKEIMQTIPQRAEGNYPASAAPDNSDVMEEMRATNLALAQSIQTLNTKLDNLWAKISYDHLKDELNTMSEIESDMSME